MRQMCNTNGFDGPLSTDCVNVASFVDRGEDTEPEQDIRSKCSTPGQYTTPLVSGQAFAESGWNVITDYADCRHPPTNPPNAE